MKTRNYYLVDPSGRIVCRVRLAVDAISRFLNRFPDHKLIRHLNSPMNGTVKPSSR